jgi:hypothetical protein
MDQPNVDTDPPSTDPLYKTHQCGENTIAMYSEEQWLKLPFVGLGPGVEDGSTLEYRNCHCGSTIAVEHPPTDPSQVIHQACGAPPHLCKCVEVPAPESSLTRLLTDGLGE